MEFEITSKVKSKVKNLIDSITKEKFDNFLKLDAERDEQIEQEICYHRTTDRVRTHRGYHCNNCGKRF